MSSVITTIKIIMFLFPFLKELFIGKDNSASKKGKLGALERIIKSIIIILGCLSVALNVYLVGKVYNLGRQNLELQKQIKDPTPKPVVYPRREYAIPSNEPHPVTDDEQNQVPKRKASRPISALPPDRESYLKELESIDKIQ